MNDVVHAFLTVLWLAGQAASGLRWFWPVTLVLVALLVAGVWLDYRRGRLKLESRLLWSLLPVIGIALLLGMGAFLWQREKYHHLADVGFGVVVLLAIVSVVALRRSWLASVSSSLCLLWYAGWCWFVAVMAITGDWL